MRTGRIPRRVLLLLLLAYLVALALIAYWPTPVDRGFDGTLFGVLSRLRAAGFGWITYDLVESAANVLLFVPLGLLLGLLVGRGVGRRLAVFLACLGASLAIELGQALLLPARYASAADVLANGTGAVIGILIAVVVNAIVERNNRRSSAS
jgi:glycopeptide antibiotics resistance protein